MRSRPFLQSAHTPQERKFQEALKYYTKIFLYTNHLDVPQELAGLPGMSSHSGPEVSADIKEGALRLRIVANQNCAQCFFMLKKYAKVIEFAQRALKLDAAAGKALMLRGRARLRLGELDAAEADLRSIASKFPRVRADFELLKKKRKALDARERRQFAGIFSRMGVAPEAKAEAKTTASESSASEGAAADASAMDTSE